MCLYIFVYVYGKFRSAVSVRFQLKSIGARTRTHTFDLKSYTAPARVYDIAYIIIYTVQRTYMYNMNCTCLPTVNNI